MAQVMQFDSFRVTEWGTVAVFRFSPLIADDREMAFSRDELRLRIFTMESQGRDASLEESVLKAWPLGGPEEWP